MANSSSDDSARRDNGDSDSERSGDVERYRQVATDALEMLDWCIGYLVGSKKEGIASRLAQNRASIKRDLMHEPAEPVPTSTD